MSVPTHTESNDVVPALGNLLGANPSGNAETSKQSKREQRRAAKAVKSQEVGRKDKQFLKVLLILPLIWVGFSATMKGFKDIGAKAGVEQGDWRQSAAALRPTDAESRARFDARNLTVVCASARAADAIPLSNAENVDEAVALLVGEGISGAPGSGLEAIRFRVPDLAAPAVEAAKRYLRWNDGAKCLEYLEL